MIRVTGGQYKGRRLKTPKNQTARPTTSRVRESLFAHLTPRLLGARVLDGFAGTGIIGIEALSRHAEFVLALEKLAANARLIRENTQQLNLSSDRHKVLTTSAETFLERGNAKPMEAFDIVYFDPPYGYPGFSKLLSSLKTKAWLMENALVIIEHAPADQLFSDDLSSYESYQKNYGDTVLTFITV